MKKLIVLALLAIAVPEMAGGIDLDVAKRMITGYEPDAVVLVTGPTLIDNHFTDALPTEHQAWDFLMSDHTNDPRYDLLMLDGNPKSGNCIEAAESFAACIKAERPEWITGTASGTWGGSQHRLIYVLTDRGILYFEPMPSGHRGPRVVDNFYVDTIRF